MNSGFTVDIPLDVLQDLVNDLLDTKIEYKGNFYKIKASANDFKLLFDENGQLVCSVRLSGKVKIGTDIKFDVTIKIGISIELLENGKVIIHPSYYKFDWHKRPRVLGIRLSGKFEKAIKKVIKKTLSKKDINIINIISGEALKDTFDFCDSKFYINFNIKHIQVVQNGFVNDSGLYTQFAINGDINISDKPINTDNYLPSNIDIVTQEELLNSINVNIDLTNDTLSKLATNLVNTKELSLFNDFITIRFDNIIFGSNNGNLVIGLVCKVNEYSFGEFNFTIDYTINNGEFIINDIKITHDTFWINILLWLMQLFLHNKVLTLAQEHFNDLKESLEATLKESLETNNIELQDDNILIDNLTVTDDSINISTHLDICSNDCMKLDMSVPVNLLTN